MDAAIVDSSAPGGQTSQLPHISTVTSQQEKLVNTDGDMGSRWLQNLTKLTENIDGFQLMPSQFESEYARDKWSNAEGSQTSNDEEPEADRVRVKCVPCVCDWCVYADG